MARVKGGPTTRRRRKKILKMAKGFRGAASVRYRVAREQVQHALQYAYVGRRLKKRDFRRLWITRISAALDGREISYSRFIYGLKKAGVSLNRKMLSEIAIHDKEAFNRLLEVAKENLS
ncbi:MAG TPA: 50S ribosomal protein L20 [Firmicutes bacterium]|nr:50S ribosomal protein L20 [Bacillota bacterium]